MRCSGSSATRFPAGYREDVSRAQRGARHRDDGPTDGRRAARRCRCTGRSRPRRTRCASSCSALGAPITLSDSLPMLERMGMKVLDERPHRIAPDGRPPIWMHDLGLLRATADTEVEIDALHAVFEDAFGRVFRGEVEERRLQPAGRRSAAARDRDRRSCAPTRSTCGRSASRCRSRSSRRRSPRTPTSPRSWSRCSSCASIPTTAPDADARAAQQVRAIERALEDVDNLSEDRVLRQYLALILATTRTNYWCRDAAGTPKRFLSFKFDPSKVPGSARAEADVRDLRLLDALRRRASARRQGRARRPALVGSARGLPHGGARARQGADGQEHGDRAGRLEGRLRAEARTGRRPTAKRS